MIDDAGHEEVQRGPLGLERGDRVWVGGFDVEGVIEGLKVIAVVRLDDGGLVEVPAETCGEIR